MHAVTPYYCPWHCSFSTMAAPIWRCPLCGRDVDVRFDPVLDATRHWIWVELHVWRWLEVPPAGWHLQPEWWCLLAHNGCIVEMQWRWLWH